MVSALEFHPLANIFPLLEGEEFDALVADVKANGLCEKIFLYDGMILDGRNRYRACIEAGIEPDCYELPDGDESEILAFVVSKNIHRRHLTAEQKRNLIAALLKATPEKSDRQIAKTVKASPTFVGKVRAAAEAAGEVSTVDTRVDAKGVKQPARKGWSPEQYQKHQAKMEEARAHHQARGERRERVRARERARMQSEDWRASISRFADKLIRLDIEMARELYVILIGTKSHEHLADDLDERLWGSYAVPSGSGSAGGTDPASPAKATNALGKPLSPLFDPKWRRKAKLTSIARLYTSQKNLPMTDATATTDDDDKMATEEQVSKKVEDNISADSVSKAE
jgi:ParB-like chromosome segregation protein Spo0J